MPFLEGSPDFKRHVENMVLKGSQVLRFEVVRGGSHVCIVLSKAGGGVINHFVWQDCRSKAPLVAKVPGLYNHILDPTILDLR